MGTQVHSPEAFVGFWGTHTPPILGGRSWESGLEQGWAPPLLPGVTAPHLKEHPQPPQHQAGRRRWGC